MKYARSFFPFFLFVFSLHLSAEEVVIRKILDSNLFETKGGQKIKLAYIDAPSITDPNPNIRSFARSVQRYAKSEMLNRAVEIEYLASTGGPAGIRPVRMWKKFPLQTVDFNKKFLENGFGKLAKEAGLPIEEAYLAAEQKAKQKHRGIWNTHYYKPASPNIYTVNMMLGAGSNKELEGDYKEVMLNAHPLANGSGFALRLTMIYGQYTYEYSSIPQDGVLFYSINLYSVFAGRNVGFEPGLILFNFPNDPYFPGLVLPNARLKIGDLKKLYLSVDFLTDLLYSPFSVGMNFESDHNYYYKLWIGATPWLFKDRNGGERWMAAFKLDFRIVKTLLVQLQAVQFNYRFDPTEYGFRVGVGYNFPVGRR